MPAAENAAYQATGPLTISLWVNFGNVSQAQTLLDDRSSPTGDNGYSLSLTSSGMLQWEVDGLNTALTGTSALAAGTWYNVAAVYDPAGGELSLYVNGSPYASTPVTGAEPARQPQSAGARRQQRPRRRRA